MTLFLRAGEQSELIHEVLADLTIYPAGSNIVTAVTQAMQCQTKLGNLIKYHRISFYTTPSVYFKALFTYFCFKFEICFGGGPLVTKG